MFWLITAVTDCDDTVRRGSTGSRKRVSVSAGGPGRKQPGRDGARIRAQAAAHAGWDGGAAGALGLRMQPAPSAAADAAIATAARSIGSVVVAQRRDVGKVAVQLGGV